jgi:hypothetical protein
MSTESTEKINAGEVLDLRKCVTILQEQAVQNKTDIQWIKQTLNDMKRTNETIRTVLQYIIVPLMVVIATIAGIKIV